MDYLSVYNDKLTTAAEAAKVVKSGDWLDFGFGIGISKALDAALVERKGELEDINIRAGVETRVPLVMKIPAAENPFTWNSLHMTGASRNLALNGNGYYASIRFSEIPRYHREMYAPVDLVVFQVSPMDRHGYFSLGPNATFLMAICEYAKKVVVEVNPNMPRCHGGVEAFIHISQVDMIVEDNTPMPQLPAGPITDVDIAVARLIVEEIPSRSCIQLGIGGMPNAVGGLLVDSDLKDLGVHTEMYVDAYVDLAMAGKITGKYKNIDRWRQCYTFALGTQKLYDYIDDNPEMLSAAVDYVNDIRVLSSLDNLMSINNTVEVDLFGQIASESYGPRQISGAGGQLDYVLGAYLSKGGKSFICCSSTVEEKDGGARTRIVPVLQPGGIVTATRANVHWLVTEYGKVNLKGMSSWQKAESIISLAHPDFRDDLIKEADKMRIWRRSNKKRV